MVGKVTKGMTADELLEAYPVSRKDDGCEALEYATDAVRERDLPSAAALYVPH